MNSMRRLNRYDGHEERHAGPCRAAICGFAATYAGYTAQQVTHDFSRRSMP